jgi:hypothetical protein
MYLYTTETKQSQPSKSPSWLQLNTASPVYGKAKVMLIALLDGEGGVRYEFAFQSQIINQPAFY